MPSKKKRLPGRPRNPAGSRTEVVKVSLHPYELELINKATDAPANFLREAGLAKAKRMADGKKHSPEKKKR